MPVGLDADLDHGLRSTSTYGDVEEYVIKYGRLPQREDSHWTVEHELTKAIVKSGGHGGRSPFELLRDYGRGDELAGRLFIEYASATFRKTQLNWSRGLKALLNIEEISDDQILDETEDDQRLLASLDERQWWFVLDNDAVGRVIEAAHSGSAAVLYRLLDSLDGMDTTRLSYERPSSASFYEPAEEL